MRKNLYVLGVTVFFCVHCDSSPPPSLSLPSQIESPSITRETPTAAPVAPAKPVPTPALSSNATIEYEQNTVNVFDRAAPATVFVTQKKLVRQRWSARALEVPSGTGSGFIWDHKGHVVTNAHVVAGARSLTVTLYEGSEYDASLVGFDRNKDIAVLKINSKKPLTPVILPPKNEAIRVGSKALAIGNPFGLDHTLTVGVISATGREVRGFGDLTIRDMLQTDAAINPGNSGGPLLNSRSMLIGMNTMIFSKSGSSAGVGFAVPVSTLRRTVPQIIQHGKPLRAGLGIELVSDELARANRVTGVVIQAVKPGSPAAKAGLRGLSQNRYGEILLGDIITKVNEFEVKDFDTLFNALDRFSPGDTVKVTLRSSGGEFREVPVQLTLLK